jgi:hypothetical protein
MLSGRELDACGASDGQTPKRSDRGHIREGVNDERIVLSLSGDRGPRIAPWRFSIGLAVQAALQIPRVPSGTDTGVAARALLGLASNRPAVKGQERSMDDYRWY